MKKWLWLFILLIASPCFAAGPEIFMGSGTSAAASCDPATKEVGSRTAYGTPYGFGADLAIVFLVTADCLGELDTAYFYSDGDAGGSASNAKICIYSTAGSAANPDSAENTQIKCSDAIARGTGAGFKSAVMGAGGNITSTSANAYWMMITVQADGNSWVNTAKNDTTAIWYRSSTGYYASPPANLYTGDWSTVATFGPFSAYVTIK